jgi:hypothetical protein
MSIYGFRPGPTYRAGSPEQRLLTALEQPLSPLATASGSAQAEFLTNPVLGTFVRDFLTPRPRMDTDRALRLGGIGGLGINLYEDIRGLVAPPDSGKLLDEEAYKASPWYRDNVPWDAAMTEDRAAALALFEDVRTVRGFYAEKRPISAFFGSLAGAALDPINYIPTVGPIVRAAAISKFGRVAGSAVTASADAAVNVAAAGVVTAPLRARFGDDISFQAQVSDIAMAAMIGGAFGLAGGAIGKWSGERKARRELALKAAQDRLQTLRRTQQARIALNEASVSLALDGEVRMSPNGLDPVAELAQELIPPVVRLTEPRLQRVDPPAATPAPGQPSSFPAPARDSEIRLDRVEQQISGLEEALNNLRSGAGFADVSMRKPVIDAIKRMGGVHPDSPLAAELRNLGVTSKTAPGLFRREAMTIDTPQGPIVREPLHALDNVPMSEVFDRFGARGVDDGAGYVSQQSWIDAVRDEMAGSPWLTPDEQARFDNVRRPVEDLDEFMSRFGIEWRGRSNAEVMAEIREVERALMNAAFDTSPGRHDGMSDPELADWRARFAASQERTADGTLGVYRVDPKTGAYLEEAEIRQLEAEGRLTDEDRAALEHADRTFVIGDAYGKALQAAVTCLL